MDSRLIFAVALAIGCWADRASSQAGNGECIRLGNLTAPISPDTCGKKKLCEEAPADCDPRGNGTCLFVSASVATTTRGGTDINFELRGKSRGYTVLILSPDKNQGNDTAFICAQSNSTLHFFTASFNGTGLTINNKTTDASNILGSLTEDVIRCTFTGLKLNATAGGFGRLKHKKPNAKVNRKDTFHIFAGKGTFDNGVLGTPRILLMSNGSLDLASLPPTGATAGLHFTSLALLVLFSALISCLV